jgi:hypothetical protein
MTQANKKPTMRDAEKALGDLLREFERCPGWLLEALIEGMMKERGYGSDEAIRELAKFETNLKDMLEASHRINARKNTQ